MAAVGADRFRPHFLAIEWDDMVDAFKSGRRKLWNVPYTRAPARGMRIARCERDDLHRADGKSRGAASGAAPAGPDGIFPNPASIAAPALTTPLATIATDALPAASLKTPKSSGAAVGPAKKLICSLCQGAGRAARQEPNG